MYTLPLPPLQDRVSLISGSRDAISDVVQLLVKKMKERREELGEGEAETTLKVLLSSSSSPPLLLLLSSSSSSPHLLLLKVVVTNSTIGMVIGKGGETVEQMKQRSGTNILISKKGRICFFQDFFLSVDLFFSRDLFQSLDLFNVCPKARRRRPSA